MKKLFGVTFCLVFTISSVPNPQGSVERNILFPAASCSSAELVRSNKQVCVGLCVRAWAISHTMSLMWGMEGGSEQGKHTTAVETWDPHQSFTVNGKNLRNLIAASKVKAGSELEFTHVSQL